MLRTRPAGFIEATEIEKAALDHGWRGGEGREGDWLTFRSTTAPGEIAVATLVGEPVPGATRMYAMRAPLPSVGAAMTAEGFLSGDVDGQSAFLAENAGRLHSLTSRAYRLAVALPDNPLDLYRADLTKAGLAPEGLGATEAERLTRQRLGQGRFRAALMEYWEGSCPLTGITEPALLRASHIVPWAECDTDAQRLDVHNGLLLSALWDAAFDAHLVSFEEDGAIMVSEQLDPTARQALAINDGLTLSGLQPEHLFTLAAHRKKVLLR